MLSLLIQSGLCELQSRRKQWRKLEVQAKKERGNRVDSMKPTAQILRDLKDAARDERRAAEAQMFRDRSLAILEQKNNEAELKREARAAEKEQRAVELRNWRAGYWTGGQSERVHGKAKTTKDQKAERLSSVR
jgi:hypothetical protein